MSHPLILVGETMCKKSFIFQLFLQQDCQYFSFPNKRESLFSLHFVLFLFSLITTSLIVHLYSIVYDILFIRRHITLTHHFIKKINITKQYLWLQIRGLSLLIPTISEEIMLYGIFSTC